MKNLHDMLRAKESQLASLQKEVEALRIAAKLLGDESEKPRGKKLGGKAHGTDLPSGTVVTQPLMIRSILLEKGQPLHVHDISLGIRKKYGLKFKPLYLTSIIYRIMKKGKLFRKEGPNTFGLLEWPPVQENFDAPEPLRIQ